MRNAARITGAALGAAVLLSGCGSSGSSAKPSSSPSVPASASAPSQAPSSPPPSAKAITGLWTAKNADGPKTLTIVGDKAATAGRTVCTGAVVTVDKTLLNLICKDHSTDRTNGVVSLSSDGKSLSVQWSGGQVDAFSRSDKKVKLPDLGALQH